AELLAANHASDHGIPAAEPARRLVQITSLERAANLTAAHANAIDRHGRHDIHRETELQARLRQQGRVRDAMAAELEVVTDDHDRRLDVVHQQPDELLAAQTAQRLVEAQLQHEAQPRPLQDSPAFAP